MIRPDEEIKAATGLITVQRIIDPDVIFLRPELLSYEREAIEHWLTETLRRVIVKTISDGREYIVKCDPKVYEYEYPKPPHERSLSKRVWIWVFNWFECEIGEYVHPIGIPKTAATFVELEGERRFLLEKEIGWRRID